jgi:hypothetical protein
MNPRTTLVLFVLAVVAIVFYLVDRRERQEESEAEEARHTLFDMEQDALRGIEITSDNGDFAFELRGSDWYMTRPLDTRADQGALTTLVRSLTTSRIERYIDQDAGDLSPFGLDSAGVRLDLDTGEDGERRLLVGDVSPGGSNAYARRGGSREVFLVPAALRTAALKDLMAFRDKSVLWADVSEITGITLREGDRRISAVKSADGKWTLTGEPTYRGDKAKIEGILNRLKALRVQEFLSEDQLSPEDAGLADPRRSAVLQVGPAGGEIRIDFGKANEDEDRLYLRRGGSGSILAVNRKIEEIFGEDRGSLRYRRLLDLERTRVSRIDLELREGPHYALEKTDGEWRLKEPVEGKARYGQVSNLLWDLSSLEFTAIAEEPFSETDSHGLANPFLRADFLTSDGTNLGTVMLGDSLEGRGEFYAYSPSNDYLAIVSRDVLANVPESPEAILEEAAPGDETPAP